MVNLLRQLVVFSSAFSVLIAQAAGAEIGVSGEASIPDDISQFDQPATTVEAWMAQLNQRSNARVTNVRLNLMANGIEIVLETVTETTDAIPNDLLLPSSRSVVGNAVIIDLPNVELDLADGDEFQAANPIEGIAFVTVIARQGIRLSITGTNAPPEVELQVTGRGIVASAIAGTEAATDPNEEGIQIVVTGEQEEDYVVDEATTATLTETPLRDIPQSIQVIPRQVIEDQQVIQLQDALRNVSGVQQTNTFGGSRDSYIIRGFDQFRGGFLRNRFREGGLSSPPVETANIDRIEVLKGPASVLYSILEPGGVI